MEHISVLLNESIDMLQIKEDGIYVDCTLGRGGHSSEILKRLTSGHLYAFDCDQNAIDESAPRLQAIGDNFTLIHSPFENLKSELAKRGVTLVDGIFMDLGVSSPQFDDGQRGFSYRSNARLDMRMDQSQELDAYAVVNTYDKEDLIRILKRYGEEPFAVKIANKICSVREKAPIETTFELVDVIKSALPAAVLRKKGHPAKQTFQAIRIELNRELEVLSDTLDEMIDLLEEDGRICIITFHSLEDRIVKNIFRKNENPCTCPPNFPVCVCGKVSKGRVITRKPILPSEEELEWNSRSQSAKLRVFERQISEAK